MTAGTAGSAPEGGLSDGDAFTLPVDASAHGDSLEALAGLGSFYWSPGDGSWRGSGNLSTLLGFDVTCTEGRARIARALPADDLALLQTAADKAQQGERTTVGIRLGEGAEGRVLEVRMGPADERNQVVLGVVTDVTDEERRHASELAEAKRDPFTGAANRGGIMAALQESLEARGPVGLIVIHLGVVDAVRGSFGPELADEAMRAARQRLTAMLRDGDTLGRLGTREFAVVLPGADHIRSEQVATRCAAALSAPLSVRGLDLDSDATLGVASSDGSEVEEEEAAARAVLRWALVAVAEARSTGPGSVVVHHAGLGAPARRRLAMHAALRRSISERSLGLYYQPVVDLETGRLLGSEALLRWDHPEFGAVSPLEVIPLAEQTGLIGELGRVVLEEACREAASWTDRPGRVGVAVNLSGYQLRDPRLVDEVSEVLASTGLDPSLLTLEVTESVLLSDLGAAAGTLAELRAIGVEISLDDFGTGYSSLAYLDRLPVQVMKLDRSFVAEITETRRASLVTGVVALAHRLDIQVVAEGVETEEQRSALSAIGVRLAQGYFFGRPMPAPELRRLLVPPLHTVRALAG